MINPRLIPVDHGTLVGGHLVNACLVNSTCGAIEGVLGVESAPSSADKLRLVKKLRPYGCGCIYHEAEPSGVLGDDYISSTLRTDFAHPAMMEFLKGYGVQCLYVRKQDDPDVVYAYRVQEFGFPIHIMLISDYHFVELRDERPGMPEAHRRAYRRWQVEVEAHDLEVALQLQIAEGQMVADGELARRMHLMLLEEEEDNRRAIRLAVAEDRLAIR